MALSAGFVLTRILEQVVDHPGGSFRLFCDGVLRSGAQHLDIASFQRLFLTLSYVLQHHWLEDLKFAERILESPAGAVVGFRITEGSGSPFTAGEDLQRTFRLSEGFSFYQSSSPQSYQLTNLLKRFPHAQYSEPLNRVC